ncbi:efflux RND transporter permease subunit [Litoribrevibacter albus]|uniref:Acriflavin resistance protein n=1 Tax=Litoribrevibacter albus TaxID=1473156 RepID=A0AA37SB90_9GAMM|nr:efflux RND transporter permease subunit [Litoribrevibacter albus]GLQ32760.1 acriflavin resistance protein [Litoribrevibacter albus]
MIAWFARNHVAANLLLLMIVIAGVFTMLRLVPVEVFPTFELETVNVSVAYRAATPEDMETGVVNKIEEAIADLPDIESLSSRASEGSATVTAEVRAGADPQKLLNDIKSRVDALSTLPADAERPVVERPLIKREVLSVVVFGDLDEKELNELARQVRDELVRLPELTQTDLEGVRPYEIGIEVSEHKLRQFGLTLNDVASVIQAQSIDLSAGRIRSPSGEILLRAKAQAYYYGQFSSIVVKRFEDGSELTLGELATIDDGFEEDPIFTRFNGKLAAVVNVYRVGDESAIQVSDAVHAYLEDNRERFPPNIDIGIWDDDASIIRARIQTLLTNAWQGALLVSILLGLFLRPVIAFWVVVGIPVTFMGAFALMPYLGVTVNVLSLFGFILVLGIVVDDAIVTGENIYSHYSRDPNGLAAAINGTKEVSVPVVFGILTTVVAFLPFVFIEGRLSVLFAQVAFVVIPVLLFSLLESKLILPAHLKHIKQLKDYGSRPPLLVRLQRSCANGLVWFVQHIYRPVVNACLNRRYLTWFTFVCVFVVTIGLISQGWTRFVFFPRIQSETARATLYMEEGTPLVETQKVVRRIEQAAFDLQAKYIDPVTGESIIENVLATEGVARGSSSGQSHVGAVRFEIMPPEHRSLSIDSATLVREWRENIGPIVGVDQLNFRAEIGRPGDPIDVQLVSQDINALNDVADKVKARLATYEGVFDISDNLSDGKQELQITLLPEAELLGFTLSDVTRQVRQAFYGNEAQRIQRGRDDIRVMVRYPVEERASLSDLDELLITTPSGDQTRFGDIAVATWGRSPSTIYHVEQDRAVNVIADIDKTSVNMTLLTEDLVGYLDELLLQYPRVQVSLEGEAAEQRDSFTTILWGGALVLFAIYTLLAIPFGSYSQPFIVMSVIPFAFIGAIGGHWLMGIDLSMMSIMGMMALVGIVVNDSLVLVDFINRKVKEGMPIEMAVRESGAARFRPVILTSLTTFLGLLPLLFETSTQAQFLIPMAISLGFGVLFATFITLILIPCHYLILEDVKTGIVRIKAFFRGEEPPSKKPLENLV